MLKPYVTMVVVINIGYDGIMLEAPVLKHSINDKFFWFFAFMRK